MTAVAPALRVVPGALPAAAELATVAERCAGGFVRHPSAVGQLRIRRDPRIHLDRGAAFEQDRCEVARLATMPAALRRCIDDVLRRAGYGWAGCDVRLVRYRPGDYVLPHRDHVPVAVFVVASGPADALVAQAGTRLVRIPDTVGDAVVLDPVAWHWVDPVRAAVRYTLSITPPPRRLVERLSGHR